MTAREAKQVCLHRADHIVMPSDVHGAVTQKNDRYWDVLLSVDPPQNMVWCTINAVNGKVLRLSHGYTRRAARKALQSGLREDAE